MYAIRSYYARKEISAIKYYAAGVLLKVLDRAIQMHGGLGVTSDTPLAGFFRNERAARISRLCVAHTLAARSSRS